MTTFPSDIPPHSLRNPCGPDRIARFGGLAGESYEEALLEGWRRSELKFPVISVDFGGVDGLADLEEITSLQAPHRVADALLRDSIDEHGMPFRQTAIGKACTNARPNHATAMYQYCPSALLFGVWDSTGPRGGLGTKFQRVLVSEIVGYDVVAGVKTKSRIDPLGIEKKAGDIYHLKGDPNEWTHLTAEAETEKGKPKLFSRTEKASGDKGTPAAINHRALERKRRHLVIRVP